MSLLDSIEALPDAGDDERKKRKGSVASQVDRLPDAKIGAGEDTLRALPYSVPKAITGLLGLPHDVGQLGDALKSKIDANLPPPPEWLRWANETLGAMHPLNALMRVAPGSSDMRGAAEKVTGPWYEPQTRAGKVADTAVQTAATMGRNWITTPGRAAAVVAGTTAGTEGAGALTDDNPWARMIGGVAGGAGPTIANAARTRTGQVVRDALGVISPVDEAWALEMQRRGREMGIPLMGTESFDKGHSLASKILSSLSGGQTMRDFIDRRPQQVSDAVQRTLIAPTGNRGTPSENAALAQKTATEVMQTVERNRSRVASPHYEAAKYEELPAQALRPFHDEAIRLIMGDTIGAPSERAIGNWYNQAFPHTVATVGQPPAPDLGVGAALPETNVGRLGGLYKQMGVAADTNRINVTPEEKLAAYPAQQLQPVLGQVLRENSPNMRRGQDAFRAYSENVVDPMRAGPVGRLATPAGFDPADQANVAKVTAAVGDATTARPQDIRRLAFHLNTQNLEAFPAIAKTWIENELQAAVQQTAGGANPIAGAKLFKSLYGDPAFPVKQSNFDEVMRGVADARGVNPDDLVRGARNLFGVLERTGRTPGMGSPTDTRGEIGRELNKSVTGDALASVSAQPLGPLAKRIDDWVNMGRYKEIANVLTAPDSVQLLIRMAKIRPNGLTMRYYVSALLGLDNAISSDQ